MNRFRQDFDANVKVWSGPANQRDIEAPFGEILLNILVGHGEKLIQVSAMFYSHSENISRDQCKNKITESSSSFDIYILKYIYIFPVFSWYMKQRTTTHRNI